MSIFEAILFGFVQGISEFLPISSTAHIIITQMLLGYEFPGFGFEIFLHIASLLAVILYYRKDLYVIISGFFIYIFKRSKEHKTSFYFSLYLVIATVITGTLGLLFEDFVSSVLKTATFIALALVLTGIFLIIIERFFQHGRRKEADMTFMDAIIIGLVQTLSVIPGISRSGSTLVAGLIIGLTKETAVRFSFLLSIPVILGTSILAISELSSGQLVEEIGLSSLIVAFVTTFVLSWIGIIWLINLLQRSKLTYFAAYCFILALFVFFFLGNTSIALI